MVMDDSVEKVISVGGDDEDNDGGGSDGGGSDGDANG